MPDRPFVLRPYDAERWRAANLYAVHFLDQPAPELERFVAHERSATCTEVHRAACLADGGACRKHCRRPTDYVPRLVEALDLAITETGFRAEWFRPFDTYPFPTAALQSGPLRLFGLRFDAELFVAGSGGPKFVRTDNEDSVLSAALGDMRAVARRLRERMRRRGLDHPPRDARGLLHLPDDLLDFSR